MNRDEIDKLKKIKKLVSEGKRRFIKRNDRDYLKELLNLGITEEQAWRIVLFLNPNTFFRDERYDIKGTKNALTFHWLINGKVVYIKLDIEIVNGEEAVCWSFHEDER